MALQSRGLVFEVSYSLHGVCAPLREKFYRVFPKQVQSECIPESKDERQTLSMLAGHCGPGSGISCVEPGYGISACQWQFPNQPSG
jgi:hypothetical protein